jgi:type IV pilus assembly protein PilY1
LDIFKDKVRVGLMTFDTHLDDGTGVDGAGASDFPDGKAGTWSYYLNDTPQTGRPAFCSYMQTQEVGARNASAPPWEGRMISFGSYDAGGEEIRERNEQIQDVLLSTRPYGATPVAGLLHDARNYFWYDESIDPVDGTSDFGPYRDPNVLATDCRRSIIILLSDGEPNLDLRPHCEDTANDGVCPYQKPQDIAFDLLNPSAPIDPDQRVETYVIGFALSKVTPAGSPEITCAELTQAHCDENPDDRAIQACCTLNKIAASGAPPNEDGSARTAEFPQNSVELRKAFSRILNAITTSLTTRTSAVFTSASGNTGNGVHQFSSSFEPLVEQPWSGKLTRTRVLCEDGQPVAQAVDETKGDDFAANVNSGVGPSRKFITYLPDSSASATQRPRVSSDPDGLGEIAGQQTSALTATNFVSAVSAELMEVGPEDCQGSTADACRDAIMQWTLGITNAEGETRCESVGTNCNVFGAIYHATPVFVPGKPDEELADESYEAFVRQMATDERPSMIYAATIDGQLHAMKTAPYFADPNEDVDTKSNNELWSFMPPAVLPALQSQYPNIPSALLDGAPVVKDIPARLDTGQYFFERTQSDAQGASGAWRTVLLAGFGKGQIGSGYYALDITEPDLADGGPKFLWQITSDAGGDLVFGNGGKPLITNVFLKLSDTDPGTEVSVAILPGGDAGTRNGTAVPAGPLMSPVQSTFAPTTEVNGYDNALAARTLTVVRLDTGEIVRSFRPSTTGTSIDSAKITVVDIPAPLSGQPAAFPGAAGVVADRVFLGDKEGRLWRLDVSKNDPANWTLDVFFDAYWDYDSTPELREPIEVAPVVSVDDIGRITVAGATGDQRVQAATPNMIHRVFSLTETLDVDYDFHAKVNWVESLGCNGTCGTGQYAGERVTGPISLFGGKLYFATSAPAVSSGTECAVGQTRTWGVEYLLSADMVAGTDPVDPLSGAAGGLPIPEGESAHPKSTAVTPGIVYGVTIEQMPTCAAEQSTYDTDPYLGNYGSHTAHTTINPGKFQLVVQMGGQGDSSATEVEVAKLDLIMPRRTVWVDSWAPIFE